MTERLSGWHGRRGPTPPTASPVLYLSPDEDYASGVAEDAAEPGSLWWVLFDAENALHLSDGEQFAELWEASGAPEAPIPFHPNCTERFASYCKGLGFDAVVLEPALFEDDDWWELTAGTFGEPQTLVLDPERSLCNRRR